MGKSIKIELFHAEWCPHCVTFLPIWEKFSKIIQNLDKTKSNLEISTKSFSYDVIEKAAEKKKYIDTINGVRIEGYPTIKITVECDGAKAECSYEGQRTLEHLTEKIGDIIDGVVKFKCKDAITNFDKHCNDEKKN